MSTFECPVVRVAIEPHPNADAIELARVGDYLAIVKKGQFKDGDLAVYIPEQAVLPEWLLKLLGFWDDLNGKGTLSGGAGSRVRAIKLRGVLSQGLLIPFMIGEDDGFHHLPTPGEHPELGVNFDYDAFPDVAEGQDFANYLGVIKYEPQVPAHLAGRTAGGDLDATIAYDFENLKKIPDLFGEDQEVVITEKIHGTCLQVGLVPRRIWEGKAWADKCPDFGDYKGVVTSKGQGAKGLMLDPGDDNNLYVRARPAKSGQRSRISQGMPQTACRFSCSVKSSALVCRTSATVTATQTTACSICTSARAATGLLFIGTFSTKCAKSTACRWFQFCGAACSIRTFWLATPMVTPRCFRRAGNLRSNKSARESWCATFVPPAPATLVMVATSQKAYRPPT